VGKAGAYQNGAMSGLHFNGRALTMSTNIRLGWKWQTLRLLRYGNNYCSKRFYSTGPWPHHLTVKLISQKGRGKTKDGIVSGTLKSLA